jgi:hypothetical protein
MTTFSSPTLRVYGELPSGEQVIPGQHPVCPGPDRYGVCAVEPPARPCAGATWRYRDTQERGWKFNFVNESMMCPAIVLDPLGPIDVPLD